MKPIERPIKKPIKRMMRRLGQAALMVVLLGAAVRTAWPDAPEERLWKGTAPLAIANAPEDIPKLHVYLPPQGLHAGTAIIVCPGGGFRTLKNYEGPAVAQWLNTLGITAFVLEYRLAPRYRRLAMVMDMQRAIRFVRFYHARYGVQPNRIGAMGFSAGGYLTAATANDDAPSASTSADPVDHVSARPDFMLLGYPLLTLLAPGTNESAVQNLLGADAPEEARLRFSPARRVTRDTPPAFIFLGSDDRMVPPGGSLEMYHALQRQGVTVELHILPRGGHGFALADGHYGTPDDPALGLWKVQAVQWLTRLGFLTPAGGG